MTNSTFGRDADSIAHWNDEAARYSDHVDSSRTAYHRGRLDIARDLLDRVGLARGSRVVDFGCGDGAFTRELADGGLTAVGLDPAAAMIEIATAQYPHPDVEYLVAGAADLARLGHADAVIALNVLAYLTDDEHRDFWAGLRAILPPGGAVIVSHSNELFDLFALNGGTTSFFAEHLTDGVSVAGLLTAGEPRPPQYNIRANPLTYGDVLAAEGFEQVAQAFFNFHPLPPALLGAGDEGRIVDPAAIRALPRLRQQLQCSTMFALARRV
jgi:2-polyprenyl-3-methyl-5-hydroxy-6-metoxy-1,4-benzoquinol methylase